MAQPIFPLDKLYEQYGRLTIQAEITQAKILEVKRKIVNAANKPPEPKESVGEIKK